MFKTLATMYKHEGGVPALYRGIIPTVAGVAPYVSEHNHPQNFLLILQGWLELYDI